MSASILLDKAEVQALADKGQATLTVYTININGWELDLLHITDSQVQLGVPRSVLLELFSFLVNEGTCFTYIS